jgi:hypothetical protein
MLTMDDSLNPLGNQNPLSPDQNPFEDPFLDALERGIENPPGFTDPLLESDGLFMDDLAKQLDAVEAGIENRPPKAAEPEPEVPTGEETNGEQTVPGVEPDVDPDAFTPDTDESSETVPEDEESESLPDAGHRYDPLIHPRSGVSSRPPRQQYGDGWRQAGHAPIRRSRPGGRAVGPARSALRYCPDSRELVDTDGCGSCEKYQHWPEGTDEEPRECWYDWQAMPHTEHSETDSGEEP